MLRNLAYPYRVDGRGTTAEADHARHVREMIEQVLFTAPGERVMRPDFGCGLTQLVFSPAGPELVGAAQLLIHSALQQTLADVIDLRECTIESDDATVRVTVTYAIRATGDVRHERFERRGEA